MFDFLKRKSADVETKDAVPNWYALFDQYQAYDVGGQTLVYRNLTPHQIIRHFEHIGPVYGAVSRIARAVSGLPMKLVDTTNNTAVKNHPMMALLRAPNDTFQQTRRSFMRDMVIWRILSGDNYVIVTGAQGREPLEMYIVNSLDMQIDLDPMGFPIRYRYSPRVNVENVFEIGRGNRFVSRDGNHELLNFSNFTTRPDLADQGGMSELMSLYYEINQYLHAVQYNLALLSNNARPSGALVWKGEGNMSDDAYAKLKQQVDTQFSGTSNAGRPMLLEGDLDWREMAIKPKDGDFRNVKNDAEEQIYKALEIPVGLIKTDGTTANNMSNLRHEFYQSRVVPLGEDICEFINLKILPRYKGSENLELQIDKENIDVFITERAEKRKIIENSTTMTINEKRKYFGEGPITGGNKIVDPNGRPIAGEDAKGEIGFDGQGGGVVPPKPLEQADPAKAPKALPADAPN